MPTGRKTARNGPVVTAESIRVDNAIDCLPDCRSTQEIAARPRHPRSAKAGMRQATTRHVSTDAAADARVIVPENLLEIVDSNSYDCSKSGLNDAANGTIAPRRGKNEHNA
ncbi:MULTISPECIES: hypothetical protein [unclassified Burkholderia]|uniref:hypothetical protein n=1 Tax=unclassified Burkholderia TaxID=2613784 RepID=UPI00158AAABA|nr:MULTISPECIES: hypothetical protein [unclassified Burkholderia]